MDNLQPQIATEKAANQMTAQAIPESILPTKEKDRTVTTVDLFFLWAAIAINLGAFALMTSFYPSLSTMTILISLFVGFGICIICIGLCGDIGMTYGITYSVYIRSCFGVRGAHIPGIIRMLPALFWAGYQTYLAAASLDMIMQMMFDVSSLWICIVIFQVVQVINAASGVKSMAIFNTIATVLLAIVLVMITGKLLSMSEYTFFGIYTLPAQETVEQYSFSLAVSAAVGGWIAVAPTFMDITRTMKRKKNYATQSFVQRNGSIFIATLLGIILVSPLVVSSGMIAGILTGTWDPITFAVEAYSSNTVILLICMLSILLAQWSTNTASNMLPAANIIINFNPKKISIWIAMAIVGVISIVIQPWKFISVLGLVMSYLANALGPVMGIMFSDYYIIRRRKLNVEELYKNGGQYSYWKEWNPAAIISLLVSFFVSFVLVPVDFGFFIGLPLSMIIYWALMKYWIIPRYPQKELEKDYVPNYEFDGTMKD